MEKYVIFGILLCMVGVVIGYALRSEDYRVDRAELATKLKSECAVKAAELAVAKAEEPERLALSVAPNGEYAPLASDAQGRVYAECLTKAEVATAKKLNVQLFLCECGGGK